MTKLISDFLIRFPGKPHLGNLLFIFIGQPHSIGALVDAFDHLPPADFDKPTLIVCHTVKGHGVDYMENQVKWHAGRLSPENRDTAIRQLEKAYVQKWGVQ